MRLYKVATRASKLALAQTHQVLEALKAIHLGIAFEIVPTVTIGDTGHTAVTGAFIKEVEALLLSGQARLAVHSLKDMPVELTSGLVIAAMPKRASSEDVFIPAQGLTWQTLPPNAKVGTSSPRRMLSLKAMRPDLEVLPIRGNIVTRLGKLKPTGSLDGIVLAKAGLDRIAEFPQNVYPFSIQEMVPAVGQGILAVQCREDDAEMIGILSHLDHPQTRMEANLERTFLSSVGGGCRFPYGALVKVDLERNTFNIAAMVGHLDTHISHETLVDLPLENAEERVATLAQSLLHHHV